MKIQTGSHFPYAGRSSTPATTRGESTFASAFAVARTKDSTSAGVERTDFHSMTRQDLRDWMNGEIRAGRMTLDESTPFVSMTLAIPVNGDWDALDQTMRTERVDFFALTKAGIEGARWRKDDEAEALLEGALQIMQRYQGQPTGVDTVA